MCNVYCCMFIAAQQSSLVNKNTVVKTVRIWQMLAFLSRAELMRVSCLSGEHMLALAKTPHCLALFAKPIPQ